MQNSPEPFFQSRAVFQPQRANRETSRLIQDAAVERERDNLPRDELPRRTQGFDGHALQTAAAWDLHARDGDAFDVVVRNDLGQFLGIIDAVKLRAANKANFVADEISMEVAVRERAAVGGNKQIGALEIRGLRRSQLDLHGPIAKLRGRALRRSRSGGFIRAGILPRCAIERPNSRSRAGAGRPAVGLRAADALAGRACALSRGRGGGIQATSAVVVRAEKPCAR